MNRHQALGWVILAGVPLLLAVWVITVIPPAVWIALVALAVVLVFAFRTQLREGWSEGRRKNRVQVLKMEVAKLETERTGLKTFGRVRVTPAEFKRELADLERKLEVARQDLRLIWQEGDGW